VIDHDSPETILRDFETLLDYIGSDGLAVSGQYRLIPLRSLPKLNAQLSHPIALNLKRPLQKAYPPIHGLYLLARATGLTHIAGTKSKPLLMIDEAVRASWKRLNPAEQYFTLLETWLMRGQPDIIGERSTFSWRTDYVIGWSGLLKRIPDQGWDLTEVDEAERQLNYMLGLHNVALLDLFGLIVVEHGPLKPGAGWQIAHISRTPLGDALVHLFLDYLIGDFGNMLKYGSEIDVPFGELQPLLQPYFPQWRHNLALPEVSFQEGVFIFKVSLGRVWRRVALQSDITLQDLSNIILNAYRFDHDHLYCFTYTNQFGAAISVYHPIWRKR